MQKSFIPPYQVLPTVYTEASFFHAALSQLWQSPMHVLIVANLSATGFSCSSLESDSPSSNSILKASPPLWILLMTHYFTRQPYPWLEDIDCYVIFAHVSSICLSNVWQLALLLLSGITAGLSTPAAQAPWLQKRTAIILTPDHFLLQYIHP